MESKDSQWQSKKPQQNIKTQGGSDDNQANSIQGEVTKRKGVRALGEPQFGPCSLGDPQLQRLGSWGALNTKVGVMLKFAAVYSCYRAWLFWGEVLTVSFLGNEKSFDSICYSNILGTAK